MDTEYKSADGEIGLHSEMLTGFGKVHQLGQHEEAYIDFMNWEALRKGWCERCTFSALKAEKGVNRLVELQTSLAPIMMHIGENSGVTFNNLLHFSTFCVFIQLLFLILM